MDFLKIQISHEKSLDNNPIVAWLGGELEYGGV
jgi:hypothetical protein